MPFSALRATASRVGAGALALIGLPAAVQAAGGMPQFDVASFPGQIFWLLVCFAVLYFAMAKLALPRIGGTIEVREAKIQADLNAAQAANDATRIAVAAQQKTIAEARGVAEAAIKAAATAASAETSAQMGVVGSRLAADIAAAERRIGDQRAQVLTGLQAMASEIAASVIGKFTGTVDNGRVAQAVEAELKVVKP